MLSNNIQFHKVLHINKNFNTLTHKETTLYCIYVKEVQMREHTTCHCFFSFSLHIYSIFC